MTKFKIVISSGDPAGCGPNITLRAIGTQQAKKSIFFVVGDKAIFERYPAFERLKNNIVFINLGIKGIEKVKEGKPSKLTGYAGLRYLDKSLEVLKKEKIRRLVTAPLSKEAVKLSCSKFSGHTEYLANYFGIQKFVMMMYSKKLKTVLLTRHVPLRKVHKAINKELVYNSLSVTYSSLRHQFKIKNPKIAFTSLNPHAGVNTFLDSEEKVISSTIRKFKKPIFGPYPSDTMFTKSALLKYDCIICAYHDQAMIPFKLLFLRSGVNITLGLPIIRTSPAHGVAFDLMREKKQPFYSSMLEAIKVASELNP